MWCCSTFELPCSCCNVLCYSVPTSLFVLEHWLLNASPYRIHATLQLTLLSCIYTSLETIYAELHSS